MQRHPTILSASLLVLFLAFVPSLLADESGLIFDVKSYGASGKKTDDAKKAIQAAVDACAKAGGGTVVLPPGEYTSGTIHLRSHVRFYIDGGAPCMLRQKVPISINVPCSMPRTRRTSPSRAEAP